MKRIFYQSALLVSLLLSGCSFLPDNNNPQKVVVATSIQVHSYTPSYYVGDTFDESSVEVFINYSDGSMKQVDSSKLSFVLPDMSTPGIKEVIVNYEGMQQTFKINVKEKGDDTDPQNYPHTNMLYNLNDYITNSPYDLDGTPLNGKVKLLIIPVWFKDSSNYITNKENVRKDIQTCYLGNNFSTGYRSVKTYYEELSSNELEIDGTVTDWYEVNKYSSYYYEDDDYRTDRLLIDAVNWYFTNNRDDKRENYDLNNNDQLDGVMLIYGSPDYKALGMSSNNMWAYCSWCYPLDDDGEIRPNVYFWASYDFMYDESKAISRTGKSRYSSGIINQGHLDTHTYIHEMGHAFGLTDYYDYGYEYLPAGGLTMQDMNEGGHDPYSALLMGWVDPYVISDDAVVEIKPFQENRDLILLTPKWNNYDSPFDEYILLELYTPTGLNKFDTDYKYSGYDHPKSTAIRMWHVDARLAYCNEYETVQYSDGYQDEPVFSPNQLTIRPDEPLGKYGVNFAFSNTYEEETYMSVLGSKYKNYNELQLIKNNIGADYYPENLMTDDDLFSNGIYNLKDYSKQFVKGTFNKGDSLDWTIQIEIEGFNHIAKAVITIDRN